MVKATTSLMHEMDVDKPQSHNLHMANGEKNGVNGENTMVDMFRLSRCKKPLPQKLMQSVGIPLPLEHVEVLILVSSPLYCSDSSSNADRCMSNLLKSSAFLKK